MKALGFAIWLRARMENEPAAETGEFSQGQIAAWEAAARQARRREWLGRVLAGRPGQSAPVAREAGGNGELIAAR